MLGVHSTSLIGALDHAVALLCPVLSRTVTYQCHHYCYSYCSTNAYSTVVRGGIATIRTCFILVASHQAAPGFTTFALTLQVLVLGRVSRSCPGSLELVSKLLEWGHVGDCIGGQYWGY